MSTRSDPVGVFLVVVAMLVLPAVVLLLPVAFLPVSLALFLILNFGAHSALHRSLFKTPTTQLRLINEIICCLAYAAQLLNYQLITTAHLNHHAIGRNDPLTSDIEDTSLSLKTYASYYIKLIILPYLFWFLFGFYQSARQPVATNYSMNNLKIRYYLYRSVPQAVILFYAVSGLLLNPIHFLMYFATSGFLFSSLQNVAHYGLTGVDRRSHALAARTYLTGQFWRRFTFGSLSHLPHHVYMRASGLDLHRRQLLDRVRDKIGYEFEIKYGIASYLQDYARQFRGPVLRRNLSSEWRQIDVESLCN